MRNAYTRWFNAYQAMKRARNPQFKTFWSGIMDEMAKQFDSSEI